MNSSVIIFPGSNCDRDMDVALKKFGFKNQMVWHNDADIPKSDLIVLPGGFSYGDYLRRGSIAGKSRIIKSVINSLDLIKVKKVVLDPVMVAKGGAKLIDDEAILILKNKLIKKVSLITPNIPEAEILAGIKIKTKEDMIHAASTLIDLGAKNVFIKGGHLNSKIVQDIFVNKKEIMVIKNKRITTSNTHGTGCTLSSAISTFFSCGKSLKNSCELATKYVNKSIRSNLNLGKGHGPINHLSSITIKKNFK